MSAILDVFTEPRGGVYAALVDFAVRLRSQFSLVWRDGVDFSHDALVLGRRLESALVEETRTERWPGTELVGHQATVRRFRLTSEVGEVLKQVRGLYDWLDPVLPEDLAFYTSDGRVWLASSAHERFAFVDPEVVNVNSLTDQVAGLRLVAAGA